MSDDKPTTRRKVTPLFVPEPSHPSSEYTGDLDLFGRPAGEAATAESPEAASQWDTRNWRRGRLGP